MGGWEGEMALAEGGGGNTPRRGSNPGPRDSQADMSTTRPSGSPLPPDAPTDLATSRWPEDSRPAIPLRLRWLIRGARYPVYPVYPVYPTLGFQLPEDATRFTRFTRP